MASDLHRHRDGSWFLDARFWGCVMGGYTKGPWKCDWTRAGKQAWKIVGSDHLGVATILVTQARDAKEKEANARLIAAAPDLLNTLMTLTDVAEDRGIPCDAARAAIAKATGEQP